MCGIQPPLMQSVSSPYPGVCMVVRAHAHVKSKLFFASIKNQPEVKQNWLYFLPAFWKNKSVVCLCKMPWDADGWIGPTWNYCDIWFNSKLTDVQGWHACFMYHLFIYRSILSFLAQSWSVFYTNQQNNSSKDNFMPCKIHDARRCWLAE